MLHLGQAAVHLPTSPHTKVWMAIVEATRPEDRGAIWGRLCNVLPCSCLNTLWKFETCRRGIRQPWNLQAHTYHASIVSGLKGFIYHSSTSQTCHELMDIYVFLIYACLHGACMYVYFPCVHLPVWLHTKRCSIAITCSGLTQLLIFYWAAEAAGWNSPPVLYIQPCICYVCKYILTIEDVLKMPHYQWMQGSFSNLLFQSLSFAGCLLAAPTQ